MGSKELNSLIEAYKKVYEPQEVEEAVKGADPEMRKAAADERKSGDKKLSVSAGKANADKVERDIKFYDKVTKKTKPSVVGMTHEEVDTFDSTLAELMEQGHTREEALKIMANPTA